MRKPIVLSLGIAALANPAVPQSQSWIHQFGTTSHDYMWAAAPAASGGVYVGGESYGDLGGSNAGDWDAWLAYHDGAGSQVWIRQLGTSNSDTVRAAAPDGSGGVFVGGWTRGGLGGPPLGGNDAWLAHYDNAGNQTWIRQFGSIFDDVAYAAAPDGVGGVYLAGATWGSLGGPNAGEYDVWLAHYDSSANQTWTRQFGSSAADFAYAAATDGSGGVYVSGYTEGDLVGSNAGYEDIWTAHYDSAGNQTWIRQFGTQFNDFAYAAAPDDLGGVYVAGSTTVGTGYDDAWLAHYDAAGNRTWYRQFGTYWYDGAYATAPDGSGGVYVGGYLHGDYNDDRAFLAHYDSAGTQMWISELHSGSIDNAYAAAFDPSVGVYLGGRTYGDLGGPNAGGADAWLTLYDACGFAVSYCTAGTTTHGCVPSIAGTGAASATAGSGFSVTVDGVEGRKLGLIFYGIDNAGWTPLPWSPTSSSLRCVKPPTQRTPAQNSGGTTGACDGVLSIDWNAFITNKSGALGAPFTGGETVYAQGWFRDPPAPRATNLSNGLWFTVCP